MILDLSSIGKAVRSLGRALAVAEPGHLGCLSADEQEVIKAGVIQNFEFTYELCWKFIKRWIEMNVSPSIADGVTRRELFRLGAENRLIEDVDQWMRYHDARNLTAHTYEPRHAAAVLDIVKAFAGDAERLFAALEERND